LSTLASNTGVKTIQHRKATGNARAQIRGFMYPVFYVSGNPLTREVSLAYGPENPVLTPSSFNFSTFPPSGVIAAGRLERIPAETELQGVSIKNREAYRLYWLPFFYNGAMSDWSDQYLEAQLGETPGVRQLESGMVIFMPTEASVAPGNVWTGGTEYDGMQLIAFDILAAPINVLGGNIEHEAIIARRDGQDQIVVSAL